MIAGFTLYTTQKEDMFTSAENEEFDEVYTFYVLIYIMFSLKHRETLKTGMP